MIWGHQGALSRSVVISFRKHAFSPKDAWDFMEAIKQFETSLAI